MSGAATALARLALLVTQHGSPPRRVERGARGPRPFEPGLRLPAPGEGSGTMDAPKISIPHARPRTDLDAVIVGAGLIGLAAAWRASQRGLRVALADPEPGSGSSHAAAGMLAPVTEAHYGEERLLRL